MKFKSKELKNYYNIGTLLLFRWVMLHGWIEGKIRKCFTTLAKLRKTKPF